MSFLKLCEWFINKSMTPESSYHSMSGLRERFVHQWNKYKLIESICTVCYATVCLETNLLLARECEEKHRCSGRPDIGQRDVIGVDASDGRSVRNLIASEKLIIAPVSERLNAMEWIDPSLTVVCPICNALPHTQCEIRDGSLQFESHIERWGGFNNRRTIDPLLARVLSATLAKLSKSN